PTHPRCRNLYDRQINVTRNQDRHVKSEKCRNAHVSCQFWAELGECSRNPRYMLDNCYLACNFRVCKIKK
uniref:ShKT domain-containing protein n=1 Tax=Romanomermis culicivorax TaxID=13658 RepID=A0A915IHV6_ROMCU